MVSILMALQLAPKLLCRELLRYRQCLPERDHVAKMLRIKVPEQDRLGQMRVGHVDFAAGLLVEGGKVEMFEEPFAPIGEAFEGA